MYNVVNTILTLFRRYNDGEPRCASCNCPQHHPGYWGPPWATSQEFQTSPSVLDRDVSGVHRNVPVHSSTSVGILGHSSQSCTEDATGNFTSVDFAVEMTHVNSCEDPHNERIESLNFVLSIEIWLQEINCRSREYALILKDIFGPNKWKIMFLPPRQSNDVVGFHIWYFRYDFQYFFRKISKIIRNCRDSYFLSWIWLQHRRQAMGNFTSITSS